LAILFPSVVIFLKEKKGGVFFSSLKIGSQMVELGNEPTDLL
jgi:hypothetical protein